MGSPTSPAAGLQRRPMTPAQVRTFNDLLAVGGTRPISPPGLAEELSERILEGTKGALDRWTTRNLWVSKGQLFTALRCEGQLQADAATPRRPGMMTATAVGIVAHRAIQIAHTHPGRNVASYSDAALQGAMMDEEFLNFWEGCSMSVQSDLKMQVLSRVTSFLDSWPPLDPAWTPRFEEPIQAKVGRLTLSARADLVIGRPRPEGRQTMILCDLKSGSLQDHHEDEAMFYALVSTLRHGIAPYRSTVYSLASGTYSEPDVTAERLEATADQVVKAVVGMVDVLTERRLPLLVPGTHCNWCPAKLTCSSSPHLPQPVTPPGEEADRYGDEVEVEEEYS